MKKFLLICSILLLFAPYAYATPIQYDIDGSGSNVTLWNNATAGWLGSATITGNLVDGLDDIAGLLSDGETAKLDFFDLTVSSKGFLAGGLYDISAALAFEMPSVTAAGTGGGFFGSIAGIINGGTLLWDSSTLPDVFTLANGNIFSINFENGIRLGLGDTATVHAFITNLSGSVPEPATFLLLGTCLIGLAGLSRKKIYKK